ncbi:AAA family ATPase [Sulfurospirillum barnesii]|uniref:DNA repair protein RecN n=1 Tax=Sulfurospirillum barnesii (strain ATCC 700032 / DSM 10660 / SES-3) TaxID=760154 RepID=I3XVP2_SULBS|nr:AAA family ATPase [Sulfurospirillum barnesii]AFL68016.1 ATPase involved in DNA repair [Sulfurospirillum barnesii SES-3]
MIERLLIKNHLSFAACQMEFDKGLVVFTGPSGAGKSVLMQALLSLFGHGDVHADILEATIDKTLGLEAFGIEEESPNIFKALKAKNARYFINAQTVSKKTMLELSRTCVNYLSVKDNNEFENSRLLTLLDGVCASKNPHHREAVYAFSALFSEYTTFKEALESIEEEEKKLEDLKEFARFEIAKIDEIAPKIGEDEALVRFKKSLSKKEKIEQAMQKAGEIFKSESSVNEVLTLMEVDGSFFDACMNELRLIFEKQNETFEALDEIDVESLLDRIEKIAQLKKRYGSIEEALAQRQKKVEELARYENSAFEKEQLAKKVATLSTEVQKQSEAISKVRHAYLGLLEEHLNHYLSQLYMPPLTLELAKSGVQELGYDVLHVNLGKVDLKKISSGEYNRVRLAFLATHNAFLLADGGVLILDEIDANLSGKESMSVANVLKTLSQTYQIFAISHQPQLSSCADQHFLVSKDALHVSHVHPLKAEERIRELARMVSGESVSEEALSFAKSLLVSNNM